MRLFHWDALSVLIEKRFSPLVNIVDPVLIVLLGLFALRGYFKGLFRESFSLVGLVAGFMVAVRYNEPAAALWADSWKLPPIVLQATAFVALFFAVYLLCGLAGWLLHRSAKVLFLEPINRMGGVVLGAGKGAALLSLILFFLLSFPWPAGKVKQAIEESYLIPPLYRFAEVLIEVGKEKLLPPEPPRSFAKKEAGVF